jgi:hypothetical protein
MPYHFKLYVIDAILFTLFTGGHMEGDIMKAWWNRTSSHNYLEYYRFQYEEKFSV